MNKKNTKLLIIFLVNILYTNYFISLSEKSDTAIAIRGLSNFNEDLADISFPVDLNLNYLQFTIFISILTALITRFIILKINTDLDPVNYLKIIGYTFFTNAGVLFSVLYLFRFFNFPRYVLFLQIAIYPFVFGLLIIMLNIYLKENSKISLNKRFITISIVSSTLILGYLVFQQFDNSRISAQRVASEETLEGGVSSLEVNVGSSSDSTDCFKWSGSDNYKSCVSGVKVKLIAEYQGTKINNIVIHESKRYTLSNQGIIYNQDNSIFLDISYKVTKNAAEEGLYDLAFHPQENIFLVSYSNLEGSLIVEEFSINSDNLYSDGNIIKEIPNFSNVHFCGALEWSSYFDSFLMCVGDMGGEVDSLDTSSQRGKIILLNADYATNPEQLTENINQKPLNNIIAYGLRNPWNFLQVENLLIIPDVGEKSNEELNIVDLENFESSGRKPYLFGWPLFEGSILSERSSFGVKNWNEPEAQLREFIIEKSVKPVVYYDRPAPENNRAAIIGTVLIDNSSSSFHKNILFADFLSKELFAYNYLNDELSIINLPPFPGYLTAISQHPDNNNKILIGTSSENIGRIYEITLPSN